MGKRKLSSITLPELSLTVKVLVFDFDKTITAYHTVGEEEQSIGEMLDNIYRFKELRKIFCDLHRAGYILCVASFAQKERIIRYLDALLGDKRVTYFQNDDIYGNGDYDGVTSAGNLKIRWLSEICEKYRVKSEQVLLVDDGRRNLDAAREIGYQTLDGSFSPEEERHFIDVFADWQTMSERLSSSSALFSPRTGLSCSASDSVKKPVDSRRSLTASV